ncbi:Putative leucine-rich repeat receptor-like serine/threonine-protein kinase At2g04300 [Rhizoctonia solani]|uniref:Putative leucine-rich repeat receptor-like serine/threonine-protein kinase At2g04300 n=1 Tax=Rhizoctonia solani TaxID=456999 RepID=A0A0K6FZL7_9AGAM|nr:Putative leucine-rich repeat receptor-like serine/threonine-protein kinase At2g04300 [Rhizoctonia solani]
MSVTSSISIIDALIIEAVAKQETKFSSDWLAYSETPVLLEIVLAVHPLLPSLNKIECIKLLENNDDLPAILEKAYEAKSFKGVMEHAAINALMDSTNDQGQGVARLLSSNSRGSLAGCFRSEYRGGAAQCFLKTTNYYTQRNTNIGATKLYNRSIFVLQSSGMGMSRMADEAMQKAAYPPPDDSLRGYFRDAELEQKSDAYEQARLAAVIMTACNGVKTRVGTEFQGQDLKGSKLASIWAQYFKAGGSDRQVGPYRRGFYEEAVGKANKYISDLSNCSADPSRFPTKKELDAIFGDLRASVKEMLLCIEPEHSETTNACYFYVDEAHTLTKPPATDSSRSQSSYYNLGKVLSQIRDLPIFFVFLSTKSHLQTLDPMVFDYSSAYSIEGRFLIPPFIELPLDIFLPAICESLNLSNKAWSLANACTTEVISGMGRPLWHAHYHQWLANRPIGAQRTEFVEDMFSLAFEKLTTGCVSDSELAALSVRVGISFDRKTTVAREAESRQVEAHMRIVYAVPEHQEHMITGYASEPILAEAAAIFLNRTDGGAGIAISGPRILADNIKKRFLAEDGRRKLCGRLLTTIAHDLAIDEYPDIDRVDSLVQGLQPGFHRPVPVLTFLRALFAPCHHDTILRATPVTGEGDKDSTLETVFKDAFVSFSQFSFADDSELLEAGCLQTALFRGMAIQTNDREVSMDVVIPIHMGPTTSPITEEATTAINMHFKNRKNPYRCSTNRGITVPNLDQPAISIVFEFGEESPKAPLVESHHASPPLTRDGRSGSNLDPDRNHYSFVARGCTSKTYNAIPEEAEDYYKIILADFTLKDDFPRAGMPESWELVRQMKPYFDAEMARAEWEAHGSGA